MYLFTSPLVSTSHTTSGCPVSREQGKFLENMGCRNTSALHQPYIPRLFFYISPTSHIEKKMWDVRGMCSSGLLSWRGRALLARLARFSTGERRLLGASNELSNGVSRCRHPEILSPPQQPNHRTGRTETPKRTQNTPEHFE